MLVATAHKSSLAVQAVDEQPAPAWARALVERIERVEADLAALLEPLAARKGTDAAFVAAIAASVHGRVFSARELVRHSSVDAQLGQVLRRQSSIQVGRRLRTLLGKDCGGWTIQRVGRDGSGIIWHVVPT
jgi:hypothetical protein